MIQPQDRDRVLAGLSFDHQFMGSREAYRYVYKGLAPRRAMERVAELEQAGFIRRQWVDIRGRTSIIRLTQKGAKLAKEVRPYEIRQRKWLDMNTLVHDSQVITTRLRLAELWDATWIPEGVLKVDQFPQIPDGVLVFKNGNQAAVEIENSDKGVTRFRTIMERWRNVPVRLVLYVATTPDLYRKLQRYLTFDKSRDLPFGLVCLPELEATQPRVWTVMGELDLFCRRDL